MANIFAKNLLENKNFNMKKLLGILVVGLLFCNIGNAKDNILILECTNKTGKKNFYKLDMETSYIIFQNGTEEQFYYDNNDFYILGSTDSIDGITKVYRRLINRYTGEGILDYYELNDQEDAQWHEKMSETMIKETLGFDSENYNEDVANRKNYMWYYWYKSLDQFEILKTIKFNCNKIKEKKF